MFRSSTPNFMPPPTQDEIHTQLAQKKPTEVPPKPQQTQTPTCVEN